MVKQIISIIILFLINIYTAFSNNYNWSFSGIFGHYDNAQIQRGLQIYKQVCSNCHSLNYVSFNALSDLNYSQEQINYLQNYYKANYFHIMLLYCLIPLTAILSTIYFWKNKKMNINGSALSNATAIRGP